MKKEKTFSIITLGCKVNQYESQLIREKFIKYGYKESPPSKADYCVVNSCTVTGQADAKTRKIIGKIKRENPSAKIIFTGCFAVLKEDVDEIKKLFDIYKVVPNREKSSIPVILGGGASVSALDESVEGHEKHTRAFLKIQDGCDQSCSYCKVSIVRGPSRSKDRDKVLDEIKTLAGKGYKEIVLTGICIGSWQGSDGLDLADLVKVVDEIPGDFRVRISSIEPNQISKKLIDFIKKSKKICRHLHIPLQSGSNKILKLMNRQYLKEDFKKLLNMIRKEIPFMGISVDVISGFPGENDEDFDETFSFLSEIKPSRIHVFKYSDRKMTKSYNMRPKVPEAVKKLRVEKLINLGNVLEYDFYKNFIGKKIQVLIEEEKVNSFNGYSGEYIKVVLDNCHYRKGKIADLIVKTIKNPPIQVALAGPC